MKVTVYEKPACMQCKQTKRKLDKEGVAYEVKSLLDDPDAVEVLKEQGYASAPGVFVHGESGILTDCWGGYNPDKLKRLANDYHEWQAKEYLAADAE